MNQKKSQINCKNILLLGTFLSATIISGNPALAAGLLEVKAAPAQLAANALEKNLPATNATGNKIAQASDVNGNWAEPFIKVLVEKNIIAGYPDGQFRPDQAVTRAEFAALLTKAFELQPTRAGRSFPDVKKTFWGASAIDKAYRSGFLSGYPNNRFGPNQNIVRIESLVSISNGSKLQADAAGPKVDELFTDSAQVPSFGRDALLAATQKCVTVSVSYPDGKTFNPNGVATRADVAAFIHQALVASGKLTALASDSPAQKYIASCGKTGVAVTEQDVQNRAGVGNVPGIETTKKPVNAPVGGLTTPTGFGANSGDFFVGGGYQDRFIPGAANSSAFGLNAGFGLGDSLNAIGLETSVTTGSSNGIGTPGVPTPLGLFDRGGINFKLHKQFGENFAVAGGWENAVKFDSDPTRETFYGVLTGVLPVGDTSNFTASVGVGNGRFRQIANITPGSTENSSTSVFGSLGLRLSENIALVSDYNGRNFNLGLPLSFQLGDNAGFQVTPAILDAFGDRNGGEESRFGVSAGLGFKF